MASWEWKDGRDWKRYDKEIESELEAAYQVYTGDHSKDTFVFDIGGGVKYQVDFTLMKQKNLSTNFQRPLRRKKENTVTSTFGTKESKSFGIKTITSLLLPKDVWHINDIANLRVVGTDGLPPKIEAPHITLLDSFSSVDRMESASKHLKEAASTVEPFRITLQKFKYFTHGMNGYTLYIDPEIDYKGTNPLIDLQKKLYDAVIKSGSKFLESKTTPDKFVPHVSLGKFSTLDRLEKVKSSLSSNWEPIVFTITEIYVMSKLLHDTSVRHVIPLGKNPSKEAIFPPVPFPTDGTYSVNVNRVPINSTDDDLLKVFKSFDPVKAQVVFKSLGNSTSADKGWGHVTFETKDARDAALSKSHILKGTRLEVFPCD